MCITSAEPAPVLACGSAVWFVNASGEWTLGEVGERSNGQVTIRAPGLETAVPAVDCKPHNADAQPVEDMVQLQFLHEPGVLHNLRARYAAGHIYTRVGSILIAVNPFAPLPRLYGPGAMAAYKGAPACALRGMEPHVFGVAAAAYRQMMAEGAGQAILITGESGAGKTETAKCVMRCLAYLGGYASGAGAPAPGEHCASGGGAAPGGWGARAAPAAGSASVEQKVLESNPLLEAFGNAKTVRNDNSSRFGKYVEIHFSAAGAISGAAVRTYLLERSRVVALGPGERSYHAFYQLCCGATEEQRARWRLPPAGGARAFRYLAASECFELAGVDDAAEYEATRGAMRAIGLREEQQDAVFQLLAALLHLGNVAFAPDPSDAEAAAVAGDGSAPESMAAAAQLLGVEVSELTRVLVTRTRLTPDGPLASPLTARAAADNRDALVKVLYSALFDWLVARVNASIGSDARAFAKIGLLDIYGFESFASNDLEQLTINLANEKLQQHFNNHVFKEEQAAYEAEGVDWSYIEFVDNADVLDLMEGRLGVLDLLDEQCRFPNATADDLAHKLHSSLGAHQRFSRPKKGGADAFTLNHYAGPVTYSCVNFLDKNRDYVVEEHRTLLAGATHSLVASLFPQASPAPHAAAANGTEGHGPASLRSMSRKAFQFVSVASQFKTQLAELLAALRSMEPHYIRCIKPNPANAPGRFDGAYSLTQLKCGGVMEAVRIACAGYPFRRPFADFVSLFWQLAPDGRRAVGREEERAAAVGLLQRSGLQPGAHYQMGTTLVFLRASATTHLQRLCHEAQSAAAARIQAAWEGRKARRAWAAQRAAAVGLQTAVRGLLGRRRARDLRLERAATVLQAGWRARAVRLQQRRAAAAATALQAVWRGRAARAAAAQLRRERAAVRVQACWRGHTARRAARSAREARRRERAATLLQARWRGVRARRATGAALARARAARRIQRAWRAHRASAKHCWAADPAAQAAAVALQRLWRRRRTARERCERLRSSAIAYAELCRQAEVVARAWRVRAAAKQLAALRERERRERFRRQISAFQAAAAAQEAAPPGRRASLQGPAAASAVRPPPWARAPLGSTGGGGAPRAPAHRALTSGGGGAPAHRRCTSPDCSGDAGGRGGGGGGASPPPPLEVVKADATAALSPQERLSQRLGDLPASGAVSNLRKLWQQRSAQ